ncbi:MAG: flagellar FlbD family protein [Bdellovibrionales bacterium]|nr:flagellar FlbD family protein [Bdellovibrionales bacterium]
MIIVHRLNGAPLHINSDLILHIEATPDTVITFNDNRKLPVSESIETIKNHIINFKRACFQREIGDFSLLPSTFSTDQTEMQE